MRTATRPAAFLDQHEGYWVRDTWPSTASSTDTRALDGPRSLAVKPDVGVSAWIDCAGHLPWGLSGDQREDDAHSLTFEWPADGEVLVGHPVARLQVSADAPLASLSVKLCDVFPDGASALVTRGSLDLTYRDGVHAPAEPSPLVPGQVYDVVVDLDACAYAFTPGQTIRLSVAGADWPNTIAPPAPVTLTVHGGSLDLPRYDGAAWEPGFTPGAEASSEDPIGRLLDHHPRRPAPDHDLLGAARVDVRRPARRHRHRGVRRRGRRRHRDLRPARHGHLHLPPHLAGHRRAGHLDHAARRTRRGLRRDDRRDGVRRRGAGVAGVAEHAALVSRRPSAAPSRTRGSLRTGTLHASSTALTPDHESGTSRRCGRRGRSSTPAARRRPRWARTARVRSAGWPVRAAPTRTPPSPACW